MSGLLVLGVPLGLLGLSLWWSARQGQRALPPRSRGVLKVCSFTAFPLALGGLTFLGTEALEATSPTPPSLAALLLLGAAALFAALTWAASRLDWARWWPAGALPVLGWFAFVQGPTGGEWDWNLALGGVMLLAAAALLPQAIAHGLARPGLLPRVGATALTLPLAAGAVLGAGFTFLGLVDGDLAAPAEHHWEAELHPPGEGAYVALVPFLATSGEAHVTLPELRDRVRVAEGEATLEWLENGTLVRVTAEGPVRLEGTYRFYGGTGHQEGFSDYRVPAHPARLVDGPSEGVDLTWSIRMRGGGGHTCFAFERLLVHLTPGDPVPLRAELEDAPDPGSGRFGTVCA